MTIEGDVVNIEAVVVTVHAAVLSVAPLEGVFTSGDVEGTLGPVACTGVTALLDTVDVEVAIVPAAFARDLAEEAHDTVGRDVDRDAHVANNVSHASAAAHHAVGAFVRIVGGDAPRIAATHLPLELAEVAGLEVLDDVVARQTATPVHFHIRAGGIQAVRIVLSNDLADRSEVLVHHVVDRAGRLVVVDGDRVALDRSVNTLVTVASSGAIVAASIDVTIVVTFAVGGEVVGVRITEFVVTHHSHSGASDTSGAVLLVHVAVHVAVAGDLHVHGVGRSAFAFIVHGGHIVGVASHVVGQRTIGVSGGTDVVHLGVADKYTIAVHIVETIGTVDNSVPVQGDGFIVEHSFVFSGEVLRNIEVGGEAPDRAAHASGATIVVELNMPEVVGVVPEVAHGVAVGHLVGEAAVLRIHDGLVVVGFRVVGATEDETPTSGILGDVPMQGHAGRLDAVFVIGRSRTKDEVFSIDSRARHIFGVDRDFEVGIGRRGHQVVSARTDAQVSDDGTSADIQSSAAVATFAVAALHDDVGTGGAGVHRVADGRVVSAAVLITVSHAGERQAAGALPVHGAVPSAIVALAVNQHVAVAVP